MVEIIFAIILGIMAITFFIIGFLQFKEKGFLFNNSYIYASEEERQKMNKKPYYKVSGIVFTFIGLLFSIIALDVILKTSWLFYIEIAFIIILIIIVNKRSNL